MKYGSAAAREEKISGCEVNKVDAYSYQRIRNKNTNHPTKKNATDAIRHSVLNTEKSAKP